MEPCPFATFPELLKTKMALLVSSIATDGSHPSMDFCKSYLPTVGADVGVIERTIEMTEATIIRKREHILTCTTQGASGCCNQCTRSPCIMTFASSVTYIGNIL